MVISNAIAFDQVTFTTDKKIILKNITGNFPAEKVTCLIGPSGSGKTTLLKMCNGLISPTSGEITILEQKIGDIPPVELRRKVGIALQHSPMMTGDVFENLALPLRLQEQNLDLQEAEKLLQDVGLGNDLLKQDVKDLSGGQKQRVAIARTLVNKPKILLLDEITASLDSGATTEIEDLILHIREKYGVTIIWITHDIQQAKRVGDHVWMLEAGEVVDIGTIELIFQKYQ